MIVYEIADGRRYIGSTKHWLRRHTQTHDTAHAGVRA